MTGGRSWRHGAPGTLGELGDVVLIDELHVCWVQVDQQCPTSPAGIPTTRSRRTESVLLLSQNAAGRPAQTSRRFKSYGAERSETAFRWSWWRFTTLETSTFFTLREVVGMPSQPIALVPASATRYTALRILSLVE